MDVFDNYTIGIRMGHFQQYGLGVGKSGDTIGFINKDKSIFPMAYRTVKSVERLNGSYARVAFNEEIPKAVQPGFLVEKQAYSEVLIENCNFSKNRAHGILIGSVKQAIIRNNYFHNEMGAMLFPAVTGHWYESGRAANVLIENNSFVDCGYGSPKGCVLEFKSNSKDEQGAFKNIRIANNVFDCFDNPIIHAQKIDGLLIEGNHFKASKTYEAFNPDLPAFHFEQLEHVKFKNNTYSGKAKTIVTVDEAMEKVVFD